MLPGVFQVLPGVFQGFSSVFKGFFRWDSSVFSEVFQEDEEEGRGERG